MKRVRASKLSFLALLSSGTFLTGCMANPGDAPTVVEAKPTTTVTVAPDSNRFLEINVGVDSFTSNMNPHVAGNLNQVVAAVADLTLPSAFLDSPEGRVPNQTLFESIEANDEYAPTSVRFTLASGAQWSDGTPITHSDFSYLKDKILETPGTKDSELYAHIASIQPIARGFEVHFDQPFSSYKDLFDHLLPSHIYGAEGRTFTTMMDGSVAASAGAFAVRSINADRGVIELQRNDRYWGADVAQTDRLTLTTVPNVHTGAQMIRTGQMHMLLMNSAETTYTTLSQLLGASVRSFTRPVQLNLVLNLDSLEQRRHVLSAVDPVTISRIATESSHPQEPQWNKKPVMDHEGVVEGAVASAEKLKVGTNTEDPVAIIAARAVTDQLNAAGIPAEVVTKADEELDAVLTWVESPVDAGDYIDQFSSLTPEIDALFAIAPVDIQEADRLISEQSLVMPLFGDSSTAVTTLEPSIDQWYISPYSGIFATAAEWRRTDKEGDIDD